MTGAGSGIGRAVSIALDADGWSVVLAGRRANELEKTASRGKEMLVVPISFVTEHIETLHEINIEAREQAGQLGIHTFRMMPAVGDSPLFIAALKDLVLHAVGIEAGLPSILRAPAAGQETGPISSNV